MKYLKVFNDLTLLVSGTKHVTTHLFFKKLVPVYDIIQELKNDSHEEIQKIAKKVEGKVQKYWFETLVMNEENMKVNHLIYITCVLDPRSKLDLVSEVLEMIYGGVKGREIEARIKREMRQMFELYKGKYGSKTPSSTSEPTMDESIIGGSAAEGVGDRIKELEERLRKRKTEALLQETRGSSAELDIHLKCQTDGIN